MSQNRPTNSTLFIPIIIAVALALGIWIGISFIPKKTAANPVVQTTSKFNSILDLIEDKYVDSVKHDLLVESAIEGMIKKLDPHSQYIPPQDLSRVNEQLQGNFGGVGIRFLIHDDTLVATHILNGSPSERSGMLPGDRLIQVNDSIITGIDLTNKMVMTLLKGEAGSPIELKAYRKGGVKNLSITRGTIPVSSIDAALMLNEKVGFIKLNSFTSNCNVEFSRAAEKLKSKGMKRLIFDLRSNGGGYLHTATDIADQFLKSGKLIVYTNGRKTKKDEYFSSTKGILENTELIILINSISASASEILAGAIQDNDRGLIMGRRSFGKGLVQDQEEFTDGSALRLTISRYYTPAGRSIQKPYGEGVDYDNDYYERYKSGELLNVDSVKFDENLKYSTLNGRTVYGGGGIYPDVFVPNDTAGASYYLTQLYYSSAFNHWAIKYLDKNRTGLSDFETFNKNFYVDDVMFLKFIAYAKTLGIEEAPMDIVTSRTVIKNRIKAEIARHVWDENGYYKVYLEDDMDVQNALDEFKKGLDGLKN